MTMRKIFPHDMGGEEAGPVIPDAQEAPVFKEDWHARALAITVLSGAHGKWNLDVSAIYVKPYRPKITLHSVTMKNGYQGLLASW